MRNSTKNSSRKLYESIMTDVSKLVKNRLNEISDQLLDRAADKAMSLNQPDRATQFIDYKLDKDRIARTYGTVTYSFDDIEELAKEGNRCTFVDALTKRFYITPYPHGDYMAYTFKWYNETGDDWESVRGRVPMSYLIDKLDFLYKQNNITVTSEPEFYIVNNKVNESTERYTPYTVTTYSLEDIDNLARDDRNRSPFVDMYTEGFRIIPRKVINNEVMYRVDTYRKDIDYWDTFRGYLKIDQVIDQFKMYTRFKKENAFTEPCFYICY